MLAYPSVVGCNPDAIPDELKAWAHWVVWRNVENANPADKPRKILFDPKTGLMARTADAKGKTYNNTPADTWGTFEQACRAFDAGTWNGIGFVFDSSNPFCGVDVDDCRNPESGELSEEAQDILALLGSYGEVSQSGTGIKIICKGKKPGTSAKRGDFEMYDQGRFFALTGRRLEGTPASIEARQSKVVELYHQKFPAKEPQPRPVQAGAGGPNVPDNQTDADLIAQIGRSKQGAKFDALWQGDTSGYDGDESSADLSLCNIICWWTFHDVARIDRLFRQSSLMRPKWDEQRGAQTYGERTIAEAMQKTERREPPKGRAGFLMEQAASAHTTRAQFLRAAAPEQGETERLAAESLLDKALCTFNTTDYANAERMVKRHGDDLRFCHEWKQWLLWDGTRWKPDAAGEVYRNAKHTVRRIYAEAANLPASEGEEARQSPQSILAAWAKKSESRERLQAMVKLAESEAEVSITSEMLDTDTWRLNVGNGTLDLRTGCLQPHDRADLFTKVTPIDYDRDAACPKWLAFLERVLPDADMRAYVKRACGYALTGNISEQCIFFLYGVGKNGKSVFTGILESLLSQYWAKTRAETIMQKREQGSIPNDIAALRGLRLCTVSEVQEGQRLNEAMIKDLSGGDTLAARLLYGEYFNFKPTFKLFMYGNHKPTIKGTDEGIWRRIRLIPFLITIPPEERNKNLEDELRAEELPGILRWALEGCQEWQKIGLQEPLPVTQATSSYRHEMDNTEQFLTDRCTSEPDVLGECSCYGGPLYKEYKEWCELTGEHACGSRSFGENITKKGYAKQHKKKGQQYIGLRPLSAQELEDRDAQAEKDDAEDENSGKNDDSVMVSPAVNSGEVISMLIAGDMTREGHLLQKPITTIHLSPNPSPLENIYPPDLVEMIEAARAGKLPTGEIQLHDPIEACHDLNMRVKVVAGNYKRDAAAGKEADAQRHLEMLRRCLEAYQGYTKEEGWF